MFCFYSNKYWYICSRFSGSIKSPLILFISFNISSSNSDCSLALSNVICIFALRFCTFSVNYSMKTCKIISLGTSPFNKFAFYCILRIFSFISSLFLAILCSWLSISYYFAAFLFYTSLSFCA